MTDTVDHTAAIFTALRITPEAHPWAYWMRTPDGFYRGLSDYMSDNMLSFDEIVEHYGDDEFLEMQLLSGTLEADGLAVRLWKIACMNDRDVNAFLDDVLVFWARNVPFAHAVHDALCEALGITEEAQ